MRLGTKILLPVVTLLVFQVSASGYLVGRLRTQEKIAETTIARTKNLNSLTAQLNLLQRETDFSVLSYRFDPDPSYLLTISHAQLQKAQVLDKMSPLISSVRGRELIKGYIDSRIGAEQVRNKLIASIQSKDANAITLNFNNWTLQTANITSSLADFSAFNDVTVEEALNLEYVSGLEIAHIIYIIICLVVLLILASYVYFRRIIVAPLLKINQVAHKTAEGNFNAKVTWNSNDEIGFLAQTFNGMTDRLSKSYAELKKEVAYTTKELHQANKELEQGKKYIEQEKVKLETILDTLPIGVSVIKSPTGEIELLNKTGVLLLGREVVTEATKEDWSETYSLLRPDGTLYPQEELPPVISMVSGQVSTKDNITVKKPDGTTFLMRNTSAPVRNLQGEIISVVSVFEDITEEKEIDKAKTEFVSLASHQLRTPLTATRWYSELLLRHKKEILSPVQRKYVNNIHESTIRMIMLVDSLLSVSRIDLGNLKIEEEPVRLTDLADSVLTELAPLISKHGIILTKEYVGKIPLTKLDPGLIRVVLQNLISNAVKYTPPGGKVLVKIRMSSKAVHLEVVDTGYGIPADQQDKLFTKLFRADNIQKQETDGTGLGLYIVKGIIEQSGGRIGVISEENKGSTFMVWLPLKKLEPKNKVNSLVRKKSICHG